MKKPFLFFLPHEKNNHRAILLQPIFLFLFTSFYLLNQFFIHSLTVVKPGVLGYSSEITADKIFILTNQQRTANGLPALHFNSLLTQSATAKAQDMFRYDYWAHNSPSGTTPWDFFRKAGYRYSIAGENLAKDFFDAQSVMSAWINSPTHKANITNTKYKEIGIGVVDGILGGVKTTLVIQHFGTPLNGTIVDATPDERKVNQYLQSPQMATEVLSAQTPTAAPSISPLQVSKVVGGIMFIVIIGVLFIDGYITFKNKTHRLTGSSTGHIGFLVVILILVIVSRSGVIF